jgi:uncharacterized protein (DUF2147 family)
MNYLIYFLLIASFTLTSNHKTIVGVWQQIDHESGKVASHIKIYKGSNGKYFGKIIKLLNQPANQPKNPKCQKCPKKDYRYNQPFIGMNVLTNLKASKDLRSASGGKALAPKKGKIFNCQIKLTNDNKKLKVRGYIGVPAIGLTQTWIRKK